MLSHQTTPLPRIDQQLTADSLAPFHDRSGARCIRTTLLMLLFACTVPARAGNGAWVTSGYEDFVQGSFDAGGDNLYVSRRGRLQMIRVWDLNGDGHVDLFFGHSHDHRGHMPVLIYPQRNGRPDAAAPLSLPTLHGTSLRPADLNCDGHLDLIVLNTPPNGAPTQPSFIYWGGPEGLSPK